MGFFKTLACAALAAIPMTSAYINNLSSPDTAVAGSKITATLTTSIYVQNFIDYSIIWGLAPAAWDCGETICIGQQIDYTSIYPGSVPLNSFTVNLTIPDSISAGDYKLVAAVPYLVGASGTIGTNAFYTNLTVAAA
ncbi:hypothetical protein JX265_007487 [Neoarthrinium moseri]|uniref:Uncharacterized protein n=1 Tax=Neoarthrinium moseri TaxID=1658444 RepID=A0A9P9WJI5_9PEZI|nr:hypothetical protein JX265_007487 [Neoarthrinium moseri]